MAELKVISQNVMHASTIVIDQVYGKLIANDVQDIIGNLGKGKNVDGITVYQPKSVTGELLISLLGGFMTNDT